MRQEARLIGVDAYSERQAHSELNGSGNAGGARNLAHLRRNADVGGGHVEVRVIHDIEKLGAKLQADPFGDGELLVHRLVPVDNARPEQRVAGRAYIRERRRPGEKGGPKTSPGEPRSAESSG